MRVTTAFKRLLDLPGVNVTDVDIGTDVVVVTVALRRRRLECSECEHSTRARYDQRPVDSRWRHLDLGVWRLEVRTRLRRLRCPTHGVRTEAVPFARCGAAFTADFEALVAWLATRMDKTAICRLVRINWRTVGRIIERVVADELDPGRLDGLFEIGVDEISWRKHHNYLTLVADHRSGKVVWGAEGRDAKTLDGFFDELGADRSAQLTAVSMDMGPAFAKSVRAEGHAPQATICLDPFHVVALGTKALDEVRRPIWQELRRLPDPTIAKQFKGARWALLKNPDTLTENQTVTLAAIRRNGGAMWRAYTLKEALRAIFAGDLTDTDAGHLLDRWCSWAQRCRLAPFVKLARTIRAHRDGILAAIRLGLANGRLEGLNNRVRLIMRRAFGFHSATAALALVMLSCGPITLQLPHEQPTIRPHP
ncbi:MAG: ISL3 family transposase [Acidimicrobiia bacterium]